MDHSIPQTPFELHASSKTDIFASPPSTYRLNAPRSCITTDASSFISATITFSFSWRYQFDQAGLLIATVHPSLLQPSGEQPGDSTTHPRWIKVGVEVFDGESYASVVVRDPWCDWSVSPYLPQETGPREVRMTVEVVRAGNALWIYRIAEGAKRRLMRKVNCWFDSSAESRNEGSLLVGAYAARPDPNDEAMGETLRVLIERLEVKAG
ncbi:hypothetical protein LTR85_000375 [Meristemomyces frigidus]|nr:hypothetical protein LTR85_000375 [Meristemomyces frigidus]